ncbi:UNVERIFIED_CONTAM: hypothetical protein FKN15_010474 [Acipenser sinensis]
MFWFLGFLPNEVVFSLLAKEQPLSYFSVSRYCFREVVVTSLVQQTSLLIYIVLCFMPVWSMLIYTSVQFLLVARRAAVDTEQAARALKTVVMQVGQLLLHMAAFVLPLPELLLSSAPRGAQECGYSSVVTNVPDHAKKKLPVRVTRIEDYNSKTMFALF